MPSLNQLNQRSMKELTPEQLKNLDRNLQTKKPKRLSNSQRRNLKRQALSQAHRQMTAQQRIVKQVILRPNPLTQAIRQINQLTFHQARAKSRAQSRTKSQGLR